MRGPYIAMIYDTQQYYYRTGSTAVQYQLLATVNIQYVQYTVHNKHGINCKLHTCIVLLLTKDSEVKYTVGLTVYTIEIE